MTRAAGVFLRFLLLSGAGWLCDISCFSLLVKVFGVQGFAANIVSSYVGVTFVWFTSLRAVFGRTGGARARFIVPYWLYQFVSILAYSQLLRWAASGLTPTLPASLAGEAPIVAKIALTPLNLATNFLFMSFFTRFMQRAKTA